MPTLLILSCSLRQNGSHSRTLAEHFRRSWCQRFPQGHVVQRDLGVVPVPHLNQQTVEAFHSETVTLGEAAREQVLQDLLAADTVLIAAPLYNMTLASPLKAWFDHAVRVGQTVQWRDGQFEGLLRAKSAYVLSVCGSDSSAAEGTDMQTPAIRALLRTLGFGSVNWHRAANMAASADAREESLAEARGWIDQVLARTATETPEEDDPTQIARLREAQAEAILMGDADAYSRLCCEDVQLQLPGLTRVEGRENFLACERALFERLRFTHFKKSSHRLSVLGDWAWETGDQEVGTLEQGDASPPLAVRKQKYLHIYRRTSVGWRYAVLSSNANP